MFTTIQNDYLSVTVTDLGATLNRFVDRRTGIDIVLGFETEAEYLRNGGHLGATVGRNANRIKDAQFTLPILLGVLTAVGGGVMRDLMAQRMPTVLYADVYAVASVVGAFFVCLMKHLHGDMQAAAWFGFFIVVLLRACAIRFRWQIYHPRPRRRKQGNE